MNNTTITIEDKDIASLQTVFENGVIKNQSSFEDIRERANNHQTGKVLAISVNGTIPENDYGKVMRNLDCFGCCSSYISFDDQLPIINVFIPHSEQNPPLFDIMETMREIANAYNTQF